MKKIFNVSVLLLSVVQVCVANAFQPESVFATSEEFAIIADGGKTTSNANQVRKSILRQNVSRLILPGDNLYGSTYNKVWAPWQNAKMSFDVVSIGNHNGGYSKEVSFFKMPNEFYSRVIDGARFVVLNSDNENTATTQIAWVDRELAQATESLIFLVYHHPSYTTSKFHTWQEKAKFQKALRPILWKHRSKITALLLGHDHLTTIIHFDDLPVIISGAVQEVRTDKPVNNVQDGVKVQTAWYFDSSPHWARLQWNSQNAQAQVQFVRASDDSITCTAILGPNRQAQLATDCSQ